MFKPALRIITGRMIGFAVAFAIPIVLVRLFDLETFGTYKQWFLLYFTILTISQIGMSESLLYFLPRAKHEAGEYMMNALVFLTLVGVLAGVVLTVLREPIAAWMSNPGLAPLIPPLAVYLVLMQASISLETVMTARSQYGWASAAYAGTDILRSAFFLLPLLVIPALPSLIYGALAFGVLRLAVAVWYYRHEFGSAFRPNLGILASQLAYALPFALYVVANVAQENLHQYAVAGLFDASTFAIYSVGCLQVPLVDVVSTTVCNVMMVSMAKEVQHGRDTQVIRLWHETVRKLAMVFFSLVGLLVLGARDVIVLLFTESYLPSVPIFMVGVSSILFAAVPIDGLLRVYAKTRTLLVINLARLGVIALMIYGLVLLFGLVGAVLVTVISLGMGKALGLWSMAKQWRVGTADVLPWRSLAAIGLAALAAAVPALAVSYSLQTIPLVRLGAVGLVYAAGYVSMTLAMGLLQEDERMWLWSWAGRTRVLLRGVA
jgi:O-antigen/teichoic acid export membrane protein